MLVVAHVSDTHMDGSTRNHDRTRAVMDYLIALPRPVDAVLISGDIADHGLVAEYEEAVGLFTLPVPVMILPGNHDVRGAYRKVMLGDDGDGPVNRVAEVGDAVFLLCDSSIPGENAGYLADETLAWMEDEIRQRDADRPVFVCFHHPPVLLHANFIDTIRQTGEERLASLMERHSQIVAVLCGHAHTAAATTFAGRPLLVAPAAASTVMLPWETDEIINLTIPPSLAFHVFDDDRRLTTHFRTVI